ncbi:uncharacterized protein CLUP02_06424 [Colletotrichum lupini]|uniref:Uncharacterized protein n=1 Tax=Colletotrichum lupini TaxID=145971 RepID=A0A9Q8SP87_9PEZI|nr:uncharacterized protein CLUP02_06424 [Colletotrichum lupini]UQC80938.1 hypothetical protein CLUP02_06424 [Colletotrichum lupini]
MASWQRGLLAWVAVSGIWRSFLLGGPEAAYDRATCSRRHLTPHVGIGCDPVRVIVLGLPCQSVFRRLGKDVQDSMAFWVRNACTLVVERSQSAEEVRRKTAAQISESGQQRAEQNRRFGTWYGTFKQGEEGADAHIFIPICNVTPATTLALSAALPTSITFWLGDTIPFLAWRQPKWHTQDISLPSRDSGILPSRKQQNPFYLASRESQQSLHPGLGMLYGTTVSDRLLVSTPYRNQCRPIISCTNGVGNDNAVPEEPDEYRNKDVVS